MSDENEPPAESKLTRSKQRWAREGRFLTGKTARPEQQRLPPGQHLTRDWPVPLRLGIASPGVTGAFTTGQLRRLRRDASADLRPSPRFLTDS